MGVSMSGTRIRKDWTSVRRLRTRAFIFPVAAFGRRTAWSWVGARISGSMNPVCLAGSKREGTSGIPTGSRQPCGNMTSRVLPRTTRQWSRLRLWAIDKLSVDKCWLFCDKQRSGSPSGISTFSTIGVVLDMWTEKSNYGVRYRRIADAILKANI